LQRDSVMNLGFIGSAFVNEMGKWKNLFGARDHDGAIFFMLNFPLSKGCDESRHCDWKVTVKEFRHTIEELEQTV
jgi:hypothetical protein